MIALPSRSRPGASALWRFRTRLDSVSIDRVGAGPVRSGWMGGGMKLTQRQTHGSIWLLALLPSAIALGMLRPSDLASAGSVLNYLGRLTGISGLSLLLVAAALSCRVPGFDQPFGGLTKLWQTHHQLAAVSFLLLLAHPVLLAFAAAKLRLDVALSILLPGRADPALWSGWAALLLLMVFLAPSFKFFGEPDYQRWKNLHRLAAAAVVLAL